MGAHIRRSLVACAAAVVFALSAGAASAQTGQVKGTVVDAQNKPVEGAKITIMPAESTSRKLETKTNKKGEFIQIGLSPGEYKITAEKDGLTQTQNIRVHLDMAEVSFRLVPGGGGPMSPEEQKKQEEKLAAVRAKFDEGVKLASSDPEQAIARFNEVLADAPKCTECYINIGAIYARQKDYPKAEAAFQQAITVNPNSAEAYNGLANVYNAQKKFDQAAEASAQASKLGGAAGAAGGAGGGNASATFNQGVILWNAQKIPEAKAKFEEALKMDPNLADAHYWLGMALLNEGKMDEAKPHFQEYLKLAPTGQYAENAKSIVGG
ncbi:MAG TPA: tetratricopeptide repeat protein [Vicinamibacterales bacterium]|nr:tetratricopeptide repeat protein [Vicinamibacterales bacterium]